MCAISCDMGAMSCDVGAMSCDVGAMSGAMSCDVGAMSCDVGATCMSCTSHPMSYHCPERVALPDSWRDHSPQADH